MPVKVLSNCPLANHIQEVTVSLAITKLHVSTKHFKFACQTQQLTCLLRGKLRGFRKKASHRKLNSQMFTKKRLQFNNKSSYPHLRSIDKTNFLARFQNNHVVTFDIVLVSSHSTMTKQIASTCYM